MNTVEALLLYILTTGAHVQPAAPALVAEKAPGGVTTEGATQAPGPAWAGLAANQTSATLLLGAQINRPGAVGPALGVIADLYLGPDTGRVNVVEIDMGDGGRPLLSWTDLEIAQQPAPQYVMRPDPAQLAGGAQARPETVGHRQSLRALLEREVNTARGPRMGFAKDVLLEWESGRPMALLVDLDARGPGRNRNVVAAPWEKVKLQDGAITVALDTAEIARLPRFGHMAPAGPRHPHSINEVGR